MTSIAPPAPLLDVDSLSVSYGRGDRALRAVHDVTFSLEAGRRYGVVGETGCGKSSVLKAVLGLVRAPNRATAARLVLDGSGDLLQLKPKRLRAVRGVEIGYVAQNPFGALHPVLTVGEQFHRFLSAHDATSGRSDTRERATAVLGRLGIPEPDRVYDGHAGMLSGGMAQRVVIGFASVLQPRLVIADEPTTALDVTVQRQVLDLIAAPDADRTLLMTTHDLSVVAQFCDEVFVMYAGRIVESGPVGRVFLEPEHPYTRALLGSVPRPGEPLASLAGAPPPLGDHGTGCSFAPRCDRSSTLCSERPVLRPVTAVDAESAHAVACHHAMTGSPS